ncbi:MAG TPA: phosphatase PAP2 family protein, partial [Candidatus Saccharimonadales bacterium]
MKTVSRPTKYYLTSLATVILLALNLYMTKVFVVLGSPMLFAIALLVEIVLLVVFLYNVIRALATPEKIIKSLVESAWGGLKTNDYVKQLSKSKSPLLNWGRRRFRRHNPYGLPLTITLLIAAIFLVNFINLLITVTSKGSLTQIDTRVLNLMPSIRTPIQTSLLRIVTTLANTQTAILLVAAMATLLWRKHQRLFAALVIVLAVGEEIITDVIKILVHRMRPPLPLRLINENSYSFPSSHVLRATILFGLLAYLIYTSYTSIRARITTIGAY